VSLAPFADGLRAVLRETNDSHHGTVDIIANQRRT
jgi:hypothetical protein